MEAASMDLLHMDSIISLARILGSIVLLGTTNSFIITAGSTDYDVVAFGFPYWWYPDYYYGYPNR